MGRTRNYRQARKGGFRKHLWYVMYKQTNRQLWSAVDLLCVYFCVWLRSTYVILVTGMWPSPAGGGGGLRARVSLLCLGNVYSDARRRCDIELVRLKDVKSEKSNPVQWACSTVWCSLCRSYLYPKGNAEHCTIIIYVCLVYLTPLSKVRLRQRRIIDD